MFVRALRCLFGWPMLQGRAFNYHRSGSGLGVEVCGLEGFGLGFRFQRLGRG